LNALPVSSETGSDIPPVTLRTPVSEVDYEWVMQTTFVLTIAVGAPLVALASLFVSFDSIVDAAPFAVRVGAGVWFLTAVGAYCYERFRRSST
jgi:hypothetical protein